MKRCLNLILALLLIFGNTILTNAQSTDSGYKVLMGAISETYSGSGKKGLAHGNGIAEGIDHYEGHFKNGLPDGFGKYIWANGDIYSGGWRKGEREGTGTLYTSSDQKTILAVWKNDTIKELINNQYKVIRASNIINISIRKNLHLNYLASGNILILFDIPRSHDFYSTLEIEPSSGYFIKTNDHIIFKDVIFPFRARISFVISGDVFVIHKRCIAEFEIYEPGTWTVTIKEGPR